MWACCVCRDFTLFIRENRLARDFNFLAYYADVLMAIRTSALEAGTSQALPFPLRLTASGFEFGYFRVKGREKARIFHRFKGYLTLTRSAISNYRIIWEQEKIKKTPGQGTFMRLKCRVKKGRVRFQTRLKFTLKC